MLTAVVLAADISRRMGRVDPPKPMLPLACGEDGPSFLERHVDIPGRCGIENTVFVVNELRGEAMRLQFEDTGARYSVNPFDTSTTGSSLCLLTALRDPSHELTFGHSGILVLDADIVY